MVKRMLRSTSKKKVKVRTPGGRTATHYKDKKPKKRKCGRCWKLLSGVANVKTSGVGKLSRSEKIPKRLYAGVLCADCLEKLLRYETRFIVKAKYPEYADMELARDLTLEKFLPKGWFNSLKE